VSFEIEFRTAHGHSASIGSAQLKGRVGRRADIDPLALMPIGAEGLRTSISGYIEAGLSKFVIRPFDVVPSWSQEGQWLSEAILDLQT
jgi:hypothetical protein